MQKVGFSSPAREQLSPGLSSQRNLVTLRVLASEGRTQTPGHQDLGPVTPSPAFCARQRSRALRLPVCPPLTWARGRGERACPTRCCVRRKQTEPSETSHETEVTGAVAAKYRCWFSIEPHPTRATPSSELWGEKEPGILKNLAKRNGFPEQPPAGQPGLKSESKQSRFRSGGLVGVLGSGHEGAAPERRCLQAGAAFSPRGFAVRLLHLAGVSSVQEQASSRILRIHSHSPQRPERVRGELGDSSK